MVTELIRQNIDKKQETRGIFLDLKKAFDTVNHKILLAKLDKYGIRGPMLDLLTDYLQNRIEYTVVDGIASPVLSINIGVPQRIGSWSTVILSVYK